MNFFHNIKTQDCTIISNHKDSVRIKHPDFPRPRYFTKSKKGNWCWIKQYNHGGHPSKEIWIVDGDLKTEAIIQGVEETPLTWNY